MSWNDVQALVLRPAHAKAVVHLLLRVAPGKGGEALKLLDAALATEAPLTTGEHPPAQAAHCTVGFSYRGLEALGMPAGYLRVFSRLAPAYAQGAPLRGARLGDSGASAPARWQPAFALDNAHVLLTLHGNGNQVDTLAAKWSLRWHRDSALTCVGVLRGERLGAPAGRSGEWVHFGLRDGLVDHRIAGVEKNSQGESVEHAAGEFLLGHPNDHGFNPFGLPQAPAEVRAFFRDSSFGVLRPMRQDVHRFQQAVEAWQRQADTELPGRVSADWVKAKLCGRWPGGEALRPGQLEPKPGDMVLDFAADPEGTGCPWSSHVRRMDARGHAGAVRRERTLLRRGMPFGPANWKGDDDGQERGLLGLFFCAGLEDQFEQLLGQWANAPPPGAPVGDLACDPLAGQHEDGAAAALIPLVGGRSLKLTGFQAWTQTLGTVFTWHPDGKALERILGQDYLPADEGGPWL